MKNSKITLRIGILMMAALALLCAAAPFITPYDPITQDLYNVLKAPSAAHLMGTDQLGRDIFTRVLYAGRIDLGIMVLAEIAPFAIGIFLGMAAGYFGGWFEWIFNLITDALIAFPFYLLVIVIAFAVGVGAKGIFITFILVGWITYARVIRGQTASLCSQEWISSAKLMGYSAPRILARELMPNVLPQAIVLLMNDMVGLLVIIVTLGYLGIGITPPTPDWGTMISEGQTFISTAWWLSLLPGLAIVYTGIGLSFIGDGLADLWRRHEH